MSSSEHETFLTFRSTDLPLISIPPIFTYCLESSGSDTESEFIFKTPICPIPLSQVSQVPFNPNELGSTFSQVALSSHTSGDSENNAPIPSLPFRGKRKIHKVNTGRFRKGEGVKRKTPCTTSSTKSKQPSKPLSKLFQQVKFPHPNKRLSIKIKRDDTCSFRDLYVPHGSQIIDMDILKTVFSLMRCTDRKCTGPLNLYQYSFRDGLQSYLLLKCTYFHLVIAEFPTTVPIGMKPDEAVNDPQMLTRKKSEVNVKALLAAHCTSVSWNDFLLTCNILGIQNTWHRMPKSALLKLVHSTDRICQQSMSLAAKQVRTSAEISNIPDCNVCAVSFDATWHRRGHYSNQGFAAAIEVSSGKVLDYVFYERVCNKCLKWPEECKKNNPEEYSEYWDKHSNECPANFSGTSHSMESMGALEIWGRSIDKHSLAYTTYIGDGDSSSYKRLVENNPYKGMENVRKEECLGHTQKRLKKHLKKAATKTLTSKPISSSKVERIGHLYALVIVQNRGRTPQEIQKALYILQDHLIEKHDNCPISTNSWCYYQKALAISAEDPSMLLPELRQPYLDIGEHSRLQSVLQNFASIEMCSALTLGLTQNSNESLHSVLWHNAPKTKRVGQKSLQASASIAVCTFNEGSMILAAILADQGVKCSRKTLAHFASMDKERNPCKIKAVMDTQKRRRRLLKSQFVAAESSRRKREKDTMTYKSGCFGSELSSVCKKDLTSRGLAKSDDSDSVCEECHLRDCPIGRKRANDNWIGCEFCLRWFHSGCINVSIEDIGNDPYICRGCDIEFEAYVPE